MTVPSPPTDEAREVIKTYSFRVKNLEGELNRHARAVNLTWNFCNGAQKHALRWGKRWPTAFDLMYLVAGACKELNTPANTLCLVCKNYDKSRRQARKRALRYRGRRSLGWVPFRAQSLKVMEDGFRFAGKHYRVFNPRELPEGAKLVDGSFAQDSEGKWFLNVCFKVAITPRTRVAKAVGIDLGLKTLATLSNGAEIDHPRFYRKMEARLATASRANKRGQVRRLQARCANARKDYIHKATTALAEEYSYVAIGDVPASKLGRTKMAKSIYDAGWTMFKRQLRYKAIALGGTFMEIDESFTTRTCSECGAFSGPEGRQGLSVRQWQCSACGADHHRDVNSARNILVRSRHGTLIAGAATSGSADITAIDAAINPSKPVEGR